jgi:hypothetical protein
MAPDFEYNAHTLLRAIYDLAGGDPTAEVMTNEAAHTAGIQSIQEADALVRYIRDMGWVDNLGIPENSILRITPAGIRKAEEGGPPMYPD